MKAWKQFEADAAKLFKTKRCWSNSGEENDFVGEVGDLEAYGQCKLVKALPLNALTKLVESRQYWTEARRIGPVCVKVRRGKGNESEPLVVLSFTDFQKIVDLVDFYYTAHRGRYLAALKAYTPSRMEGTSSD